jgi:hypothetical protein
MTTIQLQEASRLLREQYPRPLIWKTVDVFNGLNSTERQILAETQKIFPPRLLQTNPR